ncbi:MAG: hypothetical protein V1874_13210 [Spirochaetota bacterium]
MGLSGKEVDLLINKLKDKYKESAIEYKSRLFNLDAFEDRLQTALRKRMNLEAFILAEITNFEKIKQKLDDEKKGSKNGENAFSRKVERIMEENTERIKKYSEIQFHPHADLEITYLYGALSEFIIYYFSVLWIIVKDYNNKDILQSLDNRFSDFAVSKSKRHPKKIEDHILLLSRKDVREIDIEKNKNAYLKETAFLLHEVVDFTDKLICIRDKEWDNPLKFDKLYIESSAKKKILAVFSGMTPYGAILKVKEKAEEILQDFRLESFKRKQ